MFLPSLPSIMVQKNAPEGKTIVFLLGTLNHSCRKFFCCRCNRNIFFTLNKHRQGPTPSLLFQNNMLSLETSVGWLVGSSIGINLHNITYINS